MRDFFRFRSHLGGENERIFQGEDDLQHVGHHTTIPVPRFDGDVDPFYHINQATNSFPIHLWELIPLTTVGQLEK